MTDNTQPKALRLAELLTADEWPGNMTLVSYARECVAELRRQHACIAELEAQLESIGAGGVNSPLMGQPQAMPDLTALTERGAKAWAGVDAQALREGRWYMVTHDGVATLCEDSRDAEKEAKDADMAWPHSGPHRAVQLVEASTAGFTAADMATAAAQGFRDGVASCAASAGSEPVAWVNERALSWLANSRSLSATITTKLEKGKSFERPMPLYSHPSPPEGMVGVWTALPGALPEPGVPVLLDIGKKYPIRALWAAKHTVEAADDDTDWAEYDEATETYYCPEGWYEWNEHEEIHWAVTETPRAWAPIPPTTSAGSGKGE